MDEPVSFGRLLRTYRRARDLTQEDLARRVACAVATIKKIEADERRPSRELAERFAQALNVSAADVPAFLRLARGLPADVAPPLPSVAPSLAPQEVGAQDLSGREVRGYALRERLGIGGFGAVYRALQSSIQREVAVKIILPRYANHPDFIRRFEAEAQFVARLEHPHIVPLYDYWREPNSACLIMRYMRGGNLAAALGAGPLAPGAALQVLEQVGAALEAAHRAGVVHRDLKPANVLRDAEGNAYLADFGIAKDLSASATDSATQAGAIVGSPDYLSPEQISDEPITPRTDIYSLGVMLYELLTGAKPFATRTPAELLRLHLTTPLPSLRERRPELPEALDSIIQRATAKNPSERYPNALSLVFAFREVVSAPAPAIRELGAGPELITMDAERQTAVLELRELENPYKGLRAFSEADAANFFGRDALIVRLLERMAEDKEPRTTQRVPDREPGAENKEQRTKNNSLGTTDNGQRTMSRFLAVVGPSGSGKSSVVRAGLIPALRQGGLPGSEQWFMADFIPGAHPLEELELALLKVAAREPAGLAEQLGRDERGLLRAARLILPDDDSELVLVIDQFEEVFTLVDDEVARTHFLDSLVAAATDPRSRVRIVVTLRADFYDRPLGYSQLGALMRERTEVVLPLNPDELEQAIVEPAKRAGVTVEPDLVADVVRDVGSQPGMLPLLQYALTELFEQREGRALTRGAYRASGGVRGALARRAEELYLRLDTAGQEAARQLFLRLVTLGEGVEDTRRRVRREELFTTKATKTTKSTKDEQEDLTDLGGLRDLHALRDENDNSPIDEVIDRYGRAWLLTFDRDAATRAPTVEVAHEALLREWGRLRQWLDASRAAVRTQRQLAAAALEWAQHERDAGYLVAGARLAQFAVLAEGGDIALNAAEQAYLDASLAERDRQAREEQERRARELEQARALAEEQQRRAESERQRADEQAATGHRLRWRAVLLAGALALALVLALAAGIFANRNAMLASQNANIAATAQAAGDQAVAERNTAERQAREARARAWSAAALNNLEIDPERSILLSLRAISETYMVDKTVLPEAENMLHRAVLATHLQRTLSGHTGVVWRVAFSPDGTRIATGSPEDKTIRLWDAASGKELLTLNVANLPGVMAFSRDGKRLFTGGLDPVTGGWDLTTNVWDLTTGKVLLTLPAHFAGLNQDGTQVLLAGPGPEPDKSHIVTFWDAATEQPMRTVRIPVPDGQVVRGKPNPDLSRMALVLTDGSVKIYDLATGNELFALSGHKGPINDVTFSPDETRIATASGDYTAKIWDAATGKELLTLAGHSNDVYGVAFSPDGARVATASRDGRVKLWDAATGKQLLSLSGHTKDVARVAFSPDGNHLVTVSDDHTAKIWDITPGRELLTFSTTDVAGNIAVSPDESRILTCGCIGATPTLWDLRTGKPLFALVGHTGEAWDVAYSPDGTRLATAGSDKTAKLWDAQTGKLLLTLQGHQGTLWSVAFSPDSTRLATASEDQTVKVWDGVTGKELLTLSGHTNVVNDVAFSPDGQRIASGGRYQGDPLEAVVRVWDATTGKQVLSLSGHTGSLFGIAFSPDGKRIATASRDGTAKIWDAASGKELFTLASHIAEVTNVTFSHDGARLATASIDGTAKIWDVATGMEMLSLPGPAAGVQSVAFSRDGTRLISGAGDATVRIYVLRLDELIALARARLTRTWTPDECRQFLRLEQCPPTP